MNNYTRMGQLASGQRMKPITRLERILTDPNEPTLSKYEKSISGKYAKKKKGRKKKDVQ